MTEITVDFEFELHEIVYLKHAEYSRNMKPVRHIIIERSAVECHGGVQKMYRLLDGQRLIPEPILTKSLPIPEGWDVAAFIDKLKNRDEKKKTS